MLRNTLLTTVATIAVAACPAWSQNAGYNPVQSHQATPAVSLVQNARTQQANYFSFALGPSFRVMDESTNAVIIGSEQLSAMYGLFGWIGLTDMPNADAYAGNFVRLMQLENVQVTGQQEVQPSQGFQQAKYYEFSYSSAGQNYRGAALVNVSGGGATTSGAVNFFCCRPEQFDQLKPSLSQLALSVTASAANTFGAVAHFQATRPRGDYGIGDWKPTSTAMSSQTSQKWQDAMMGRDTMHDPQTGKTYQMQYGDYRPELGGYVNPDNSAYLLNWGPTWAPYGPNAGWQR